MENNSTWTPSQPSRTNWAPSGFSLAPSVLYVIGAVVCVFAATILYLTADVAAGRIDLKHPANIPALDQIYAQLVTYAVLLPYLLFFLPRVAGRSLSALGFSAPSARQVGLGVIGIVAMFLAVDITAAITQALTHYKGTEAAVALMKQLSTPYQKVLFVIMAAVLAPIVEELAFRAFLFNAVRRYASAAVAVVISGLAFGAVHVTSSADLIPLALPLAAGGMVLALVYRTSGSYWSNVITHAGFNLAQVVAVFVFHVKT